MQDINCAVHLCSLLHRRYADFSPLVLKTLQSSLSSNRGEDKVQFKPFPGHEIDLQYCLLVVTMTQKFD